MTDEQHEAQGGHDAFLSDTTVVLGREITITGGLYTVVFILLAVATVLEIIIGGLPEGVLLIPLLLAFAVIKATLVVMYYMHLKTDSRLFTWVLIVPLLIALAAHALPAGSAARPLRMTPALAGQVALVTGGAKRVGRAIALELAASGAHVLIHYHSSGDTSVNETLATIRAQGVQAWRSRPTSARLRALSSFSRG